jgi:hypothetical protein
MYKIEPNQKKNAKKLGVVIKPSTNPKKKIDVFKDNEKIASIGAKGYMDYEKYKKIDPNLAQKKRTNYKKRHEKDRHITGSNGYYADKILWN